MSKARRTELLLYLDELLRKEVKDEAVEEQLRPYRNLPAKISLTALRSSIISVETVLGIKLKSKRSMEEKIVHDIHTIEEMTDEQILAFVSIRAIYRNPAAIATFQLIEKFIEIRRKRLGGVGVLARLGDMDEDEKETQETTDAEDLQDLLQRLKGGSISAGEDAGD